MASRADGLILGGRAEQAESAMLLSRENVRRISTQLTFRLACTKKKIDRKLLSSTLRASKKGRLGFVLAAAGLFQHPRDSFSHNVWNVVRK